MLLIGLSGKLGTGKDSAVDCIREIVKPLNLPVIRVSMADPLKEEVAEFLSSKECIYMSSFLIENGWYPYDCDELLDDYDSDTSYSDYTYEEYLERFHDPIKKVQYRRLLQWWGTNLRRKQQEDYWVLKNKAVIEQYKGKKCIFCIADIRFPDEAELVMEYNGVLIRIERPGPPMENEHISETAMDGYRYFNHTVYNAGTIEELREELDNLLVHYINSELNRNDIY